MFTVFLTLVQCGNRPRFCHLETGWQAKRSPPLWGWLADGLVSSIPSIRGSLVCSLRGWKHLNETKCSVEVWTSYCNEWWVMSCGWIFFTTLIAKTWLALNDLLIQQDRVPQIRRPRDLHSDQAGTQKFMSPTTIQNLQPQHFLEILNLEVGREIS